MKSAAAGVALSAAFGDGVGIRRRPVPKRGQVKGRIATTIVHSIASMLWRAIYGGRILIRNPSWWKSTVLGFSSSADVCYDGECKSTIQVTRINIQCFCFLAQKKENNNVERIYREGFIVLRVWISRSSCKEMFLLLVHTQAMLMTLPQSHQINYGSILVECSVDFCLCSSKASSSVSSGRSDELLDGLAPAPAPVETRFLNQVPWNLGVPLFALLGDSGVAGDEFDARPAMNLYATLLAVTTSALACLNWKAPRVAANTKSFKICQWQRWNPKTKLFKRT